MMRVTLGLATLATVALSQELFLSSPKSCKLAALAGKWMVKDNEYQAPQLVVQVTLDSKTCELSANISYEPDGPFGQQLSNFQPVDLSADLLNPLGWRQSGDIAVQGFRATVATHAKWPPYNTTTELLGWHDPSTQSLTTFVSDHNLWLWVPLTKHAGRGAVANHRPSPRAAVSEAMTLGPCRDKKWSANFKSFLGWFRTDFLVTSTADFPDYNPSDALTRGFGAFTDEDDRCDLKFSIFANGLMRSTRSAIFTNFAEVELSSKMYQELGLSWAADGAPRMAASMEVSTEHGNGSALSLGGEHGYGFIYCRYDDNSKEIFHLVEAN